jgi:hypothetical protein
MANTNNQFSISLPDEWKDTTVFTFQGPHDSGVQHNLVLVIDPEVDKKMDAATYAKLQLGQSQTVLPGFEMVNEEEKTIHGYILAYQVVYKYMPTDDLAIFQKQLFIINKGKAYSFTSSFSKKTLKTIAHEVDEIIASFIPAEGWEEE